MRTGWQYRVTSVVGVVGMTMLAVFLANQPLPQRLFTTYVPLFWRLDPVTLTNGELDSVLWVTTAVFVGCLFPLFKPRPRRILDIVSLAQQRIVVAGALLATLGYFNWSHRLPRATLVMTCGVLFIALPTWFVLIRRRPNGLDSRAIIVGDDTKAMGAVLDAADTRVLGYVSPLSQSIVGDDDHSRAFITDGGAVLEDAADEGHRLSELDRLGGLSRLDEVLVEYDIDTALLAFSQADRAEFFGTLDACYDHGVTAKVHREHADSVLTTGYGSADLVNVDLEPWDTLDHLMKRTFDVTFSVIGLFAAAPLMLIIALAIKLDDGGPVFYSQDRTATFGDRFTVYKFRTMVEDVEDAEPLADDENPYITNVGAFLRRTHMDELPQLWAILIGEMSVVGPRAVWINEEFGLESVADDWRKRWFVKPGLTGLAQINGVTSTDPEAKLRYDMEYIRRQSLWFDFKIITRQIWKIINNIIVEK